MKKKVFCLILALTVLLGTVAVAVGPKISIDVFPGVKISMDGKDITPEDREVFMYNDSTYVPLRWLAELLGVQVGWDEATDTVLLGEQGGTITDGIYTGVGAGKIGNVTVEVVFAGGKIASVTVKDHQETAGICEPAIERIPQAIVDNQSVVVDKVSGATVTSDAIKAAVKSCIEQAGGKVSDFEKEIEITDGETVEYDADIVIVGAGAAGLMAAHTASKGGAKVIVMEKAPNARMSNFSMCGGPAGAETKVAAKDGVTTTNKEVFDHLYDFSKTTVNAKLLWEVFTRAGVAIDNMVDLGVAFRGVDEDTYGVGYRARHSFDYSVDRITPITSAVEANGGQFLYSTPGEHIIMENGTAVGVQGTNADGDTVIVHAKAVMICTGGFQGNQEMLKEHFGDVNVISLGSNLPTGDGINMVLEAGGTLDRNFGVLGDEFKGDNSKAAPSGFMGNSNLTFWLYGGLFVDRSGSRFMNEKRVADFPLALGGEAVLRQGKVYAVMDAAYYDACCNEGIISYLGDPEDWISKVGLFVKDGLKTAPDQLDAAIEDGWAYKADTLAEAAEYFGLENLEATVAEYNEACANGVDPIFGKSANFLKAIGEGPYYVFEYEPAAWSTFGGVKTDSFLRAVGANGDVIPGLYCGGCEVGSYYAVPYYDGPGTCVGLSIGSGVWAAENMLDYIGK